MRVSVFGIGHVGAVTAACLARDGHEVLVVEPDERKRARLLRGEAPVAEPGLGALVAEAVAGGRLRPAASVAEAVTTTRASLVCVATPGTAAGPLDLGALDVAASAIGEALAAAREPHVVALRSTVLPGTTMRRVLPALEAGSGRRHGEGFSLAYHPDFGREGSAIQDHDQPAYVLVGSSAAAPVEVLRELNRGAVAPFVVTDPSTAEAVKFVTNAWHALKVAFANEIDALCEAEGVDGGAVMDLLCQDARLNLSAAYLRPAFAYGGPCLGKDLRALAERGRELALALPLLSAVEAANGERIERARRVIRAFAGRRLGLLGLSFKPGVADLRESPLVALALSLLADGFELAIHDHDLVAAGLAGRPRALEAATAIERDALPPALAPLLRASAAEVVGRAELVIIGKSDPAYRAVLAARAPGQAVVDLARLGVAPLAPVRAAGA